MIGPRGERDYVEKLLDGGLPCTGGSDKKNARLFDEQTGESTADMIKKNWLPPHVAVELEEAV